LSDEIAECLWAPLAGYDLVAHLLGVPVPLFFLFERKEKNDNGGECDDKKKHDGSAKNHRTNLPLSTASRCRSSNCRLWISFQCEELRVICGTRGNPDTVAPFRAWRGSRDLVAQSPKFHAPAAANFAPLQRKV